jgi:hypothetical protein
MAALAMLDHSGDFTKANGQAATVFQADFYQSTQARSKSWIVAVSKRAR